MSAFSETLADEIGETEAAGFRGNTRTDEMDIMNRRCCKEQNKDIMIAGLLKVCKFINVANNFGPYLCFFPALSMC